MNNEQAGCGALVVALVLIAIGVFVYLKTSTCQVVGQVTAMTWQRDIQVERFKALPQDTHVSRMPADAYNVARYTKLIPYSYACGQTCHESCSGSSKTRSCYEACSTNFCTGPRPEDWAKYTINRWAYDHTLRKEGSPRDERVWPDFTPAPEPTLGNDRESARSETFFVAFKTPDGKAFTYSTPDLQVWQRFGIEADWTFNVNRLEEPQWDSLRKKD